MSAFMCSDEHISALVNGAAYYKIDLPKGYDAAEWFAVLVAENVLSLTARYGKRSEEGKEARRAHRYVPAPALPVVHVMKLAQSYDYQSCEHDGWQGREVERWIENLIRGLVFKLPGYSEAPWSI